MLCQKCLKNQATFHYKSNQNGSISEKHLCNECAKSSGFLNDDSISVFNSFNAFDGFFNGTEDNLIGGLLGNIFSSGKGESLKQEAICSGCGIRASEFIRSGKLGCTSCYKTFANILEPTLKRIHGNVKHNGKFPDGRKEHIEKQNKIEKLKKQLAECIEKQEYENAAKLRDQIRELENSENDGTKEA